MPRNILALCLPLVLSCCLLALAAHARLDEDFDPSPEGEALLGR